MTTFLYPRQRLRLKARLFELQGGKCCYCGKAVRLAPEPWGLGNPTPDDFATLEHLQRKADGGSSHPDNLAVACFQCNTLRGEMNWCEFASVRRAA